MPTKPLRSDFSAIPYAERQLIVVLPDNVVALARAAEEEAARANRPVDWALQAAEIVSKVSVFNPLGSILEITQQVVKALAKARQSGLTVLEIGRSDALGLQFPPGHPRDAVLYVGHPAIPTVYYTVASFHRMTFEHKFAEAVDLLMHLGAKEIRVEHVRGWSREFASSLSVSLPLKEQASARTSSNAEAKAALLYEASLRGSSNPQLPKNLVWYPHESTWQSLAKGRIEFGLIQFSLTVNYEDDFGVNAGLRASAHRVGFELGGSFADHEATTWTLCGKFADDQLKG